METIMLGAAFGAVMGAAFALSALIAGLALQWLRRVGRKGGA